MSKAIILMGLPLAGKSSWIKENIDTDEYRIVSADVIKENHLDYNPYAADKLHQYSVIEAENMMIQLSNMGRHIVMDTGGINNSYTVRIIEMLKTKGYIIQLVHIKTPYQICIQRAHDRERKVPNEEIIKKAIKEKSQFHRLIKIVNEHKVVDYFTNKHIFVDMDGVIAALSTLPIINGEIDFVNGEVHRHLSPVIPIIKKLKKLERIGYTLYILSAAPNSFSINEKNEWLDANFNIQLDRRFFVNQGRHKAEMLDNLHIKLKLKKNDIMMLDDFHDILYKIKDRGMNAMHVSEFIIFNFHKHGQI